MATTRARPDIDAIDLLVADHRRVEKLFRAFAAADRSDHTARQAIVGQACAELKRHATLEAEIVYPAAVAALGADGVALVNEAQVEHRVAERLVADLERLEPGDARYAPTFAVLAAYVRHHVAAEQNGLFARLRDSSLDLRVLAARLHERNAALLDAADTPGQVEPSADAEGRYEPELDEALARRLVR